ncbi:MAG TPA: nicotinate phosphoribosyltransferase [Sphingobacteriaceae bacterium]|nr:nicotinate phosphoribosyltransferase [Sphingobacteriaceae bacterium]
MLTSWHEARHWPVAPDRRLHSATHEEIIQGATADIYWFKTLAILDDLGLADTVVGAEVFARKHGVVAGVAEVQGLLRDAAGHIEVLSLAEGETFSPGEPIMQIRGPYRAFGPYETALLGILASASGWATAAREIKEAAGDSPVISFGARHVHPAVAPVMERAALVGGCDGASCILAARLMGQRPVGTIPHACVLIAGDTLTVARTYDALMPADEPRIILVDTFKDEAEESLRVAQAMGRALAGVRLDTPRERGGVTPELVREIRARLDQQGFGHVSIFCSGGMNPEKIAALKAAGAGGFGVGSYISGAKPIDMTMDVLEVAGEPRAKRGRIPGMKSNPRLRPLPLNQPG